jgi:hypothetical protein
MYLCEEYDSTQTDDKDVKNQNYFRDLDIGTNQTSAQEARLHGSQEKGEEPAKAGRTFARRRYWQFTSSV